MSLREIGFENNQIIRKNAGSPAVSYTFLRRSDTILIDNLSTVNGGYVGFNTIAGIGSAFLYIPPNQARAFDIRASGVSILGSGATTPEFQIVSLDSNSNQ